MDLLMALQTRVSCPLLTDPGPTKDQIEQLIKAAIRAPDHANMRPWRFLLIEGGGRDRMGELLAAAALADNPSCEQSALDKARRKPHRAPAMLVVIASIDEHPKVPAVEQIVSAGAAANNIVSAAFALGIGAYWRTGGAAYHPVVKEGLGLTDNEQIIGFIYLGTPKTDLKPLPDLDPNDYLQIWE